MLCTDYFLLGDEPRELIFACVVELRDLDAEDLAADGCRQVADCGVIAEEVWE